MDGRSVCARRAQVSYQRETSAYPTENAEPVSLSGPSLFYTSRRYVETAALDKLKKEKRDRLVTLAFASVLLVLIYGPAAPWFVAADRFLFDTFAARVNNDTLNDAVIVSIDPDRKSEEQISEAYGQIVRIAKDLDVARLVMAKPPAMADATMPEWTPLLDGSFQFFAPTQHRLAARSTRSGYTHMRPDPDGILRNAQLWQLYDGEMMPSLAMAIALSNPDSPVDARISGVDDSVFLSNYRPLPRVNGERVLAGQYLPSDFRGKTVFVDAEPALEAAAGKLPSGQYATISEITAQLVANVEHGQTIVAPSWAKALEWLFPVLAAVVAGIFLPGRKRPEILATSAAIIAGLVVFEALMLTVVRVRIDLGGPVILLMGTGILATWLSGTKSKSTINAFKRGSDFLAAGRLEPAFAEFRQCDQSDTLAAVMYKLSLAFEEQAKPERAEAVLDWLKRTQGPQAAIGLFNNDRGVDGAPKRLGRYVIERKLGRGAMGAVYLARDPRINRPVALKVIPLAKEFEDEELAEARIRFFREAESAGRLTHPNIVTVYDAGEDKELAYIAMEYLQGQPLTRFTDPQKLLAPNKALELVARTAEALDYAHNQGVVHRDIKPANILYNLRDDTLKISDFGVARLTDNNRTKTGIVLGTPMYMSPEQLNAEPITGHSDLFSLGVTLYELLTGEVPFKAPNIAVLMTKITSDDPPPVSGRRSGVSASLDAVLLKAMAKRPQDRFANGGEMAIALRNCARVSS